MSYPHTLRLIGIELDAAGIDSTLESVPAALVIDGARGVYVATIDGREIVVGRYVNADDRDLGVSPVCSWRVRWLADVVEIVRDAR